VSTIDTTTVRRQLSVIVDALYSLQGKPMPDPSSKTRNAEAAPLTRELLHIDHLLSQAKVDVMSIYWSVKDQASTGRTTP